jgi:hypothetical protein
MHWKRCKCDEGENGKVFLFHDVSVIDCCVLS